MILFEPCGANFGWYIGIPAQLISPIELPPEEIAFINRWVEIEVKRMLLAPFRIPAERLASSPFEPFFHYPSAQEDQEGDHQ